MHPTVKARVLATTELPVRGSPKVMRANLDARAARRRAVMNANLKRLHEAGVPIVMGTDIKALRGLTHVIPAGTVHERSGLLWN